jgi:hypothetical protein
VPHNPQLYHSSLFFYYWYIAAEKYFEVKLGIEVFIPIISGSSTCTAYLTTVRQYIFLTGFAASG